MALAQAALSASPGASVSLLLASFALGLGHAFEVDHMTAVSAFLAAKPRPRDAAVFGAKWAIGHGISLLIFGSVLFSLKLAVRPGLAELFERFVGVALFVVGAWTLFRLRRHIHVSHEQEHKHDHLGIFGMGMLHGIAGTAAFVGQAFVVASQSYAFVVVYTILFSLGVLLSMTVFAGALGAVLRRANRGVQMLLALWACIVGVFWFLHLV